MSTRSRGAERGAGSQQLLLSVEVSQFLLLRQRTKIAPGEKPAVAAGVCSVWFGRLLLPVGHFTSSAAQEWRRPTASSHRGEGAQLLMPSWGPPQS